jgi:hypothetical protein
MGLRLAAWALGITVLAPSLAGAATKAIDLDAETANGAESRCDLNVLSTFPVRIENVVTNRALSSAFDFAWASAGPGGFTSSVAPGTAGGVGARWTWTTNQSVYAFTGGTCETDICFLETEGPEPGLSTCSTSCLRDGVALTLAKGSTPGEVSLDWSGGTPAYTVYRSASPASVTDPAHAIAVTDALRYVDPNAAVGATYYLVRASTCLERRPCASDADCNPVTEGRCVSRGPFQLPGRSLTAAGVTVSSASLTSSLVTFFSPPTEVFRATSTAQPGGTQETLTNGSTTPVAVVIDAFPAGCCPADPDVAAALRCGEECVDYLDDPLNCGACGHACGEGTCCSNGNCASLCAEGWTWCDGQCADLLSDRANCGACGSACAEGACCNAGTCVPTCETGRALCGSLCYDLQNDPLHCGACGNACDGGSICTGGTCVVCGPQGGRNDACDNRCVNTNTDPYNCGGCGRVCDLDCPSGFTGVCSNGRSCRCEEGTPAPPPPSQTPTPTPPACPNPGTSSPVDGICPNPDPSPGPMDGVCPNPRPTSPVPGWCPDPGPPAPDVEPAPPCTTDAVATTIPPGGAVTICRPGGTLFKEAASVVSVCGDTIPGPDGTCQSGVSNVSSGTFMRLVPDTDTEIGDAFLTPYAVRVLADDSRDGLIQPGETVLLAIEVLNAGPVAVTAASATLLVEPTDLTDDGVDNPLAWTVHASASPYGTIPGTLPAANCGPVVIETAINAAPFQLTVPAEHPGDTSAPLTLRVQGSVNGGAFSMDVPLAVGIADRCADATARDYDGLDGLRSPMARLVPAGDPVPFPDRAFNGGQTRPLKLRQMCGGVNLRGADIDPPEIVGLDAAARGPIDIRALDLNDDTGLDDLFFRWNDSTQQWIYNLRTTEIGTGVFTLTIRVAGRKDYVTGFVLR